MKLLVLDVARFSGRWCLSKVDSPRPAEVVSRRPSRCWAMPRLRGQWAKRDVGRHSGPQEERRSPTRVVDVVVVSGSWCLEVARSSIRSKPSPAEALPRLATSLAQRVLKVAAPALRRSVGPRLTCSEAKGRSGSSQNREGGVAAERCSIVDSTVSVWMTPAAHLPPTGAAPHGNPPMAHG